MKGAAGDPLFCDDLRDALGHVVNVAGGFKRVACLMRPTMPADSAAGWLRKALKDGERERLDLEDVQFILRLGRNHNTHVAMRQLARDAGYGDPSPIEPEDEKAALQREFIAHARRMEQLAQRIEGFGK